MTLKEKLMNNMMDKQFSTMTTEERQTMMDKMMDKFFSNMSDEEKQNMMREMMPKMMGKMMGGEGGNPMMGMMSMMMGGGKNEDCEDKSPMEGCMEMMTSFKETASTARFATPELRNLFDEWSTQIENEILSFIKEKGEIKVKSIAEKFALSEDSVQYLLGRLAAKDLIDYKV